MLVRSCCFLALAVLGACARAAITDEPWSAHRDDAAVTMGAGANGDEEDVMVAREADAESEPTPEPLADASSHDAAAGKGMADAAAEAGARDAALVNPEPRDAMTDAASDAGAAAAPDAGAAAAPDASCRAGVDGDGDGMDDCTELGDGDDWTDLAVFNGMKVRWRDQCGNDGQCNQNNSRSKVEACMSGAIREEKNQRAGWDWNDPDDDICDAAYGFLPNWSQCGSRWQAQWRGFMQLKSAGNHCFAVIGSADEGCGAVFFNTEDAAAQSGGAAKCYNVQSGVYPIMWHYTMDNGSRSSLRIAYCAGGASPCSPTQALPAKLLRPTYP